MKTAEVKRDLLYSLSSVINLVILLIVYSNSLRGIVYKQVIPHKIIATILLTELLKVLLSSFCYPSNYIIDSNAGYSSTRGNLPVSKKDSVSSTYEGSFWKSRIIAVCTKLADIIKGLFNFLGAVLIGHIMFVFFGAPFIEKWVPTLEFSFILISWLYFPLTLVIRPASILQELMYISSWKFENSTLARAKWRFLLVVMGGWSGAVVIPLDWDRPWQRWPTPCLLSSCLVLFLVDVFYSIYLGWMVLVKRSESVSKAKSPRKAKHF